PITNSYEPDPEAALSYALNGKRFHLSSADEFYSFDFTSQSSANFLAQFQALDSGTTYCFSSAPCFGRTLHADTGTGNAGFSATNPVVFYARLFDPPSG